MSNNISSYANNIRFNTLKPMQQAPYFTQEFNSLYGATEININAPPPAYKQLCRSLPPINPSKYTLQRIKPQTLCSPCNYPDRKYMCAFNFMDNSSVCLPTLVKNVGVVSYGLTCATPIAMDNDRRETVLTTALDKTYLWHG